MSEYLTTVTGNITKHYLIDATSNEEALSTALDCFLEGEEGIEDYNTEMTNVTVKIESIGNAEEDEFEEENEF